MLVAWTSIAKAQDASAPSNDDAPNKDTAAAPEPAAPAAPKAAGRPIFRVLWARLTSRSNTPAPSPAPDTAVPATTQRSRVLMRRKPASDTTHPASANASATPEKSAPTATTFFERFKRALTGNGPTPAADRTAATAAPRRAFNLFSWRTGRRSDTKAAAATAATATATATISSSSDGTVTVQAVPQGNAAEATTPLSNGDEPNCCSDTPADAPTNVAASRKIKVGCISCASTTPAWPAIASRMQQLRHCA